MHMARVPWRSITVAPCNMLHHSPPQTRKKLAYERRAPIWPTLPYCIGTEKTPYLMRSSQGLDRRSSGPNQLLRMFRGEKRPAAVPAVVGTVRTPEVRGVVARESRLWSRPLRTPNEPQLSLAQQIGTCNAATTIATLPATRLG